MRWDSTGWRDGRGGEVFAMSWLQGSATRPIVPSAIVESVLAAKNLSRQGSSDYSFASKLAHEGRRRRELDPGIAEPGEEIEHRGRTTAAVRSARVQPAAWRQAEVPTTTPWEHPLQLAC